MIVCLLIAAVYIAFGFTFTIPIHFCPFKESQYVTLLSGHQVIKNKCQYGFKMHEPTQKRL